MKLITDTLSKHIRGTLSCYDRVVLQETLHPFCYAEGMTSFLKFRSIRIFDYKEFAKQLQNALIENAKQIAKDNNLKVEYLRKKIFRKEDRIAKIIKSRGLHPGLVHIFSALEPCSAYPPERLCRAGKPWHDKKTHRTFLKCESGKGLHYYFYFIHKTLGLCYIRARPAIPFGRVPTWCPFRLQIYFNGHSWLASKLRKQKINYQLIDNAFVDISNFDKAQTISDLPVRCTQTGNLEVGQLHRVLDSLAKEYCPITSPTKSFWRVSKFQLSYHWSIMPVRTALPGGQIEYATDIVFSHKRHLQGMYDTLTRTALHTVKPQNIATFLGKKLHGSVPLRCNYQGEAGNNFNTRIEGTRIKHSMSSTAIKMYDKFGTILRIETTSNDISFFQHYRKVEHTRQRWLI